jgi:exodeoxyribonuclease VII small subunit
MSKRNQEMTYELAYAELSKILQVLQNQEISLEEMTAHLRRAKELITFCQEQLHITETELGSIFDEEE